MIVVPVDITGEQKVVMAYLSIRQVLLVGPAALISIAILLKLNVPFMGIKGDIIVRFLLFFLINGTTSALAFIKLTRRDQYLSTALKYKILFLISQKKYIN